MRKRQRTESRASSAAAPPPQPRVSAPLQAERRRARQLDESIESHEAALACLRPEPHEEAGADDAMSSSPAVTQLRLEDDVEQLKNELFDESVDQHQLQLVVDRLKLSWAAMGAVFPRSSGPRGASGERPFRSVPGALGPENDRLQVEVRRRDAKNEEALRLVKQLEAARAAARDAEDSCRELQQSNRDAFARGPENVEERPPCRDQDENMILRHLLLSLAGGTGVNWAADPTLRELLSELETG